MTINVRERTIPFKIPSASYKQYQHWYDFTSHASALPFTVNGIQITESEGHPWPQKNRGPKGDVGGDFYTQKRYVEGSSTATDLNVTTGPWDPSDFTGTIQWLPIEPSEAAFPAPAHSSNDDLDEYGATAIARCKPTKSAASLATALGELHKDGLPQIVGSSLWEPKTRQLTKRPADEFLNVQFGWKPLLNDVRKVSNAVLNADKLTRQYIRDAGKPVRRKYRFPTYRSVTDPTNMGPGHEWLEPYNSYLYDGSEDVNTYFVDDTTIERWFSGSFQYALPPSTGTVMGKRVGAATKVLGAEPTPDTLWNLAPWSWAVDWFTNTGDVVSNLTDWGLNGLVMHYGYMMEHSIVRRTYYTEGSHFVGANGRTSPHLTFITEVKQRRKAHPFGFGVHWDGLTPVQLAIAAALGISKG